MTDSALPDDGHPAGKTQVSGEPVQIPENVTFGDETWRVTNDETDRLSHGCGGTWLVFTKGTRHLLDLDAGRYLRSPGRYTRAGPMPYDDQVVAFTRVDRYPVLGHTFLVWFDEPSTAGPAVVEHFRRSSTVKKICRLLPN